jgi:hypothetical protein
MRPIVDPVAGTRLAGRTQRPVREHAARAHASAADDCEDLLT